MDTLSTLHALGFEMPGVGYLVGVCLFSILGWIAYRRGAKAALPRIKWLGVALMLYPYGVSATWLLYAIGLFLCVGIFYELNR